MSRLHIKAGEKAYKIIKDGGFDFNAVSAYFGAAVGPRWLVASGFDLAFFRKPLETQTCNLIARRGAAFAAGSTQASILPKLILTTFSKIIRQDNLTILKK